MIISGQTVEQVTVVRCPRGSVGDVGSGTESRNDIENVWDNCKIDNV